MQLKLHNWKVYEEERKQSSIVLKEERIIVKNARIYFDLFKILMHILKMSNYI